MAMDIKFKLDKQGAIRVINANFMYLSEDAFVLAIECEEKRPDFSVGGIDDDGVLYLLLEPDENTLRVRDDAPRDENGKLESTFFEVSGLSGKWYVTGESDRHGPWIYGVRNSEYDESWPSYHQDHDDE